MAQGKPNKSTDVFCPGNFRQDPETGCWDWQRGKSSHGYGQFRLWGEQWAAPRIAYGVAKGFIPEGVLVCHHCDNPGCINPDHLFLGVHAENSADMVKKGRSHKPYGNKRGRGNRVHDYGKVRELRGRGLTQMEIMRQTGIPQPTVSEILNLHGEGERTGKGER